MAQDVLGLGLAATTWADLPFSFYYALAVVSALVHLRAGSARTSGSAPRSTVRCWACRCSPSSGCCGWAARCGLDSPPADLVVPIAYPVVDVVFLTLTLVSLLATGSSAPGARRAGRDGVRRGRRHLLLRAAARHVRDGRGRGLQLDRRVRLLRPRLAAAARAPHERRPHRPRSRGPGSCRTSRCCRPRARAPGGCGRRSTASSWRRCWPSSSSSCCGSSSRWRTTVDPPRPSSSAGSSTPGPRRPPHRAGEPPPVRRADGDGRPLGAAHGAPVVVAFVDLDRSRPSTTPSGTRPATTSCAGSPTGCAPPCATATAWRVWAGTSSPSS